MEIYSNTEKLSSENKIFKNKLKDKDESLKPNEQILSSINKSNVVSPPKKLKKDNGIQKEYEETKIVNQNDPNTKETYINVKSKVVFGEEKSENSEPRHKGKVSFGEKKNIGSLNENSKKPSDDDIITEELRKLSEKKTKQEVKTSFNPLAPENMKQSEIKLESEIIRNSNEIPKKEKLDVDFVPKKKAKLPENVGKPQAEEPKPVEKAESSGKKVKKVKMEEPVKVFLIYAY